MTIKLELVGPGIIETGRNNEEVKYFKDGNEMSRRADYSELNKFERL